MAILVCKSVPFNIDKFTSKNVSIRLDTEPILTLKIDFKKGSKIGQLEITLEDIKKQLLNTAFQNKKNEVSKSG